MLPPSITSFTPTIAREGDSVVITGSGSTGTTSVTFGGTAAQSFTVDSDTQVTATVGNGSSGDVEITTALGTASLPGFEFTTFQVLIFNNQDELLLDANYQNLVFSNQDESLLNANYQDLVFSNQDESLLNADYQDLVFSNQDESLLV